MTSRHMIYFLIRFVILLCFVLVVAACGNGERNDDFDSNEYFRPTRTIVTGLAEKGDTQPVPPNESSPNVEEVDIEEETELEEQFDEEIDLADDIVRRYINDTYKYSLDLICQPFCNVNSPGIDQVGFAAVDGTAAINIVVADISTLGIDDLQVIEANWRVRTAENDSFNVLSRRRIVLPSDGISQGVVIDWEIDRRDIGGSNERWRTLITQVGPLVYFLSGGALSERFASIEDILQQSLDSFLARQVPPSAPGLYSKWEFVLPYDSNLISGEYGKQAKGPNFNSGIFILQTERGQIHRKLTWDSISNTVFDAIQSVDDAVVLLGGIVVTKDIRGQTTLSDDTEGSFAIVQLEENQNGLQAIEVYSWYCVDSGRSFLLESFSYQNSDFPGESATKGFQCAATQDAFGD